MRTETVILKTALRFHARPVAALVGEAERWKSDMYVRCGVSRISVKSIIGLMTLGLAEGAEITLEVEGSDESEAMAWMKGFFEVRWPLMH